MKCYRCGQEIPDGVSVCVHCHSDLSRRSAVKSPAGRAMRTLYDRYGCREVLLNPAYLTNGLGDLLEDSKNLRNRVRMGMEAGLGKLYYAQLPAGATNPAFYTRARKILVEDAGLNEKTAGELIGYFDEMVGWPVGATTAAPRAQTAAPGAQTAAPGAAPRTAQTGTTQTRQTEAPGGRSGVQNDQAAADVLQAFFSAFPTEAVPAPSTKSIIFFIIFGSVLIGIGIAALISTGDVGLLAASAIGGIVFIIIGIIKMRKTISGARYLTTSYISRNGAAITVSWTPKAEFADKNWYVACDGKWIAANVNSPFSFTEAVPSRIVVLAVRDADGILKCVLSKLV